MSYVNKNVEFKYLNRTANKRPWSWYRSKGNRAIRKCANHDLLDANFVISAISRFTGAPGKDGAITWAIELKPAYQLMTRAPASPLAGRPVNEVTKYAQILLSSSTVTRTSLWTITRVLLNFPSAKLPRQRSTIYGHVFEMEVSVFGSKTQLRIIHHEYFFFYPMSVFDCE